MIVFPIFLTAKQQTELSEFHEAMKSYTDYSRFYKFMVQKVIYKKSWKKDGKEHGLAIFEAANTSIYFVEYGGFIQKENTLAFEPKMISEDEAKKMIAKMEQEIIENNIDSNEK